MLATSFVLEKQEIHQIELSAKKLRKWQLDKNLIDRTCAPELDNEYVGLIGEYVASLYFGIDFDFDAIFVVGRPDVANGCQVRTTTWRDGHLITHDHDKSANYIFATVNLRQWHVDLRGWLNINDCRLPKYWRDASEVREASYWTPQSDLKPMHELDRLLNHVS